MLGRLDLSYMQAMQLAAMPDVCEIHRVVKTLDSAGGWTEAYSLLRGGIPCRVSSQMGMITRERLDQPVEDASLTLTLPIDTDVQSNDRVLACGRTFEVSGRNSGSWATALRVQIREINALAG